MDDMDDDARYPPNPYPSNPRRPHLHPHSSTSSSLHRSRPPHRPPLAPHPAPPDHLSRRYPDDDDDEDEDDENVDRRQLEEDEDEQEDEDDARGEHPIQGGDDEDGDDDSSMESRGKRRRIDKFSHGFELASRALPPAAVAAAAPSKTPVPSRSSPADWSEGSTFVLLDAWGNRYVQNGRKSLRSDEWSEVSKIVSMDSRFSRSDAQCRNRLDTLKKKYKKEKMRLGEHGNLSSSWVYFKKMDALMSSPSPPPSIKRQQQQPQPPRLPCGVDAGEYVFGDSSFRGRNGNDEMRDSPGDTETDEGEDDEDDEDDSDDLPPRSNDAFRSSGSSFKILADSIQKFGKIYKKMENNKRQQMAELERMRKDFQRDLEAQKRQILERAQAEIARIREEVEYEEEEEERLDEDEDEDDDDNDDENGGGGGSAENLSGSIIYLAELV